jgi:hypothetical protein
VLKPGQDLALGSEAPHFVGPRAAAQAEQLKRDLLLVLPVGALGQVDRPHSSASESAHHAIGADAPAVHFALLEARVSQALHGPRGRSEVFPRPSIPPEKGVHLTPKLIVAGADVVEDRRPFGGVVLQDTIQHLLYLLPSLGGHDTLRSKRGSE